MKEIRVFMSFLLIRRERRSFWMDMRWVETPIGTLKTRNLKTYFLDILPSNVFLGTFFWSWMETTNALHPLCPQ
jgi:hypothetical protein